MLSFSVSIIYFTDFPVIFMYDFLTFSITKSKPNHEQHPSLFTHWMISSSLSDIVCTYYLLKLMILDCCCCLLLCGCVCVHLIDLHSICLFSILCHSILYCMKKLQLSIILKHIPPFYIASTIFCE